MDNGNKNENIDRIKALIEERNTRYSTKGGGVSLAGIEGGTVKIAPAGFCWR